MPQQKQTYKHFYLNKPNCHNMKQINMLWLLLLLPCMAWAQKWDDAEYRRIEQNIKQTAFPDRTFPITRYGASLKASAATNQKAINRAIDACSKAGGGKVVVSKGVWNVAALRLKDNVNLVVEEGATLRFAFEPSLYPLVRTSWEGLGCYNYSPCIYAYRAKNIALTGKGTIDGNGSRETWWPWCGATRYGYVEGKTTESQRLGSRAQLLKMAEDGVEEEKRVFGMGKGLRPQLVNFVECETILIKELTLINSPFWVIHPLRSKSITVDGVKIWNEGPNGDGCDPEACDGVLIQNCTFHTGDDCIAIKSGRNNDGRLWNMPSQNIIVRNCKMEDGHGGVVVGSEISGGCRNVYAENCYMDSPHLDRVLRIKTNNCRGGLIENIHMRNVTVGECNEAVLRINLNYEPNEDCYRGFQPTVRNVSMENVTCNKSQYGVLVIGLNEIPNVYNILVKNCTFNGVSKEPVKITGLTKDITFDNLTVNGSLVLNPGEQPYDKYSSWFTASEMKRVAHPYFLDFSKRPKWSYVMGIEMEGMLDTYLTYGDQRIIEYLKEYPAEMIDEKGNIKDYNYDEFNLDNVRTAKFIFRMNELFPQKNVDKALKTLFKQLQNQPRTKEGVFWHKAIYANQVWLDGIFMGLPYYTLYAAKNLKGKKQQKVFNDVVDQIVKTDQRTFDPKTGLWKHAWDETRQQFWANKENGQSKHTWARALGWYVMAITEVLDALPADHPRRSELTDVLTKAMKAVVKYQDKKTGVWYDVMDVQDSRNYLEATASSMFAYVLLKGARLGYLPAEMKADGVKAYKGILKEFIKVNKDKTLSLTRCCAVSGLGPGSGPYVKPGKENFKRDGSFDYYMSEPIRDNDAKGIGPFIWASLEMERNSQ